MNLLKSITLTIALSIFSFSSYAESGADKLSVLKQHFINDLLETTPDEATINGYLESFDIQTGAWSDVDYASQIGSGWKTSNHPLRVADMSKFYVKYPNDTSSFTHKELLDAIHAAWGYWFREKPYCDTNWFPNKIACPRHLSCSFLLMKDEISEEELNAAREIVFIHPTLTKTSANLMSFANIILTIALLEDDVELAKKAIAAIESTIYVAQEKELEGIQEDNSFHQHGPQQQFGNYGRAIMGQYSNYMSILQGTPFALSEKNTDIITNFICEGYDWVLWRGYLDINCSGRAFSSDHLKRNGDNVMEYITKFSDGCDPERKSRIHEVVKQNISKNPITRLGQKSFYSSDGMIHRTPTWMASVKMSSIYPEGMGVAQDILEGYYEGKQVPFWLKSMNMYNTRIVGGEQGDDNLKGYYIGDGAFYTYVDGDEYENAPVLWDWRKIPGITCYESDEPIKNMIGVLPPNMSSFVGTCTDGKSGITTMEFYRDSIMAHKSWVVTDDFVLALGSDIKAVGSGAKLTTSIDQKLAKSDLLYLDGGSWREVDSKESIAKKDMRFYHDKTGYIVLDKSETVASIEERTGDWHDITRSSIPTSVTADLFSLFIRHSKADDTYKYIILPARSKEEVTNFDVDQIEIMSNESNLQLVKYNDCYYVAAYKSGVYKFKNIDLEITTPGLFMFDSSNVINAYDPTQRVSDDEMKNSINIKYKKNL